MEQLGPMFLNAFFIMILGMSIVFIFLLILITSVTISSKIIKLTGLDVVKEEPAKKKRKLTSTKEEEENVVAAISAAITQHRKNQNQD